MLNCSIIARRLASIMVVTFAGKTLAVSVPSTLPLIPRIHQSIDPEFAAWLKEYAEAKDPLEMSDAEFAAFVAEQRPVEASCLKLHRLRKRDTSVEPTTVRTGPREDRASVIKAARKVLSQELQLAPPKRHILLGTLASEIAQFDTAADDNIAKAIEGEPAHACSQKEFKLDLVKRPFLEKATQQEVTAVIDTAYSYESLSHRRKLLDAVATHLPDSRRPEFVRAIRDAGGNLPVLIRRHQWLQNEEYDGRSTDPWQLTSRHVRKRDCATANKEFSTVLGNKGQSIAVQDTIDIGVSIEQCWRSQQRSAAVTFWESAKPQLITRFGDVGGLWADLRQGYLLWSADKNTEAALIYQTVLKEAEGKKDVDDVQAKAVYTLGKIAESGNDFASAIDLYTRYVAKFPNGEDFEFALNGLVVARAAKGEWKELISPLKDFLDQQALLPIDQRPVGNMAFSLFWIGRAYLNLGQADLAKEMWRRLAAEYYSTFYGAMGHFLLEQSSGRVYALEPSRVSGFKLEPLVGALNPKQRDVVERTLALLRLGLRDKARCEADELNGADKEKMSADVRLVRALVLHASGAWLEAIRIFDAMPRSVRGSLPVGFERILFPRRYSELVNRYAAKVGLDPDLVFAVMRQESVFAKEAMSPVGAMGLMQLMPSTASLELGKLPKNYVNLERKNEIHQLLTEAITYLILM